MKKRKGISLIVLIITIIVIIILSTAVIVSIVSNNPIDEANKARYESDVDSMQAVFTNTVAKIMAKNQGTVNVTEGQLNTVTSGVKTTTGEVSYTVTNAVNSANQSGTILFSKGENTDSTFYTGKELPIYAAGETKWYVDDEGNISLEVAGKKYGNVSGIEGDDNNESEIVEPEDVNDWEYITDEETGTITLTCYKGDATELVIPNRINGIPVKKVSGNLKSVYTSLWDASICEKVGPYQISQETITKIIISDGIEELEGCFYHTEALEEIIIPESVTKIGNNTFGYCSKLTNIVIPSSVTNIGNNTFYECIGLTSIKVEEGNTVYDSRDNCNAIIETSTNTLLQGCNNTVIPESITGIADHALFKCSSLSSANMPNVTSIGESAFYQCTSLSSVNMPKVASISLSAFNGCESLSSIYIPESLPLLTSGQFYGCTGLATVVIDSAACAARTGKCRRVW